MKSSLVPNRARRPRARVLCSALIAVAYMCGGLAAQQPGPGRQPTGRQPVPGRQATPAGKAPATQPPGRAAPPQAAATANQQPKVKAPENVDLVTRDGVELKATYYPGWTRDGKMKDVVPVVLLHMWKGNSKDLERLAKLLQLQGHAVVVPDLRGHGKSTRARRGGRTAELDAALLRPADFGNMVKFDMETIKNFLLERNNKEELNIEKLVVVGAEMGAAVAVNWAALDWSWPVLATLKQGRDVKGLVLISPELSFKGLKTAEAFSHPAMREAISTMIIVGGQEQKYLRDARRIFSMLEKFHPLPPENERQEKQDLFFFDLDTSLQGTQLLNEQAARVDQMVLTFIHWRLAQKSFPWTDRTNPLE